MLPQHGLCSPRICHTISWLADADRLAAACPTLAPRSFLQQNMLSQLAPGSLSAQRSLLSLNLTCNQLDELSGLSGCSALQTLLLADNRLQAAALEPLPGWCPSLESLDLQNNLLTDGEAVLAALARLPRIKCLYLKGNKLVSTMRSYRKAFIAALPGLTYLDDRPVFEAERISSEAWWVPRISPACLSLQGATFATASNPGGRSSGRRPCWGARPAAAGAQQLRPVTAEGMRCLPAGLRAAFQRCELPAQHSTSSSTSGSNSAWQPSRASERRGGGR